MCVFKLDIRRHNRIDNRTTPNDHRVDRDITARASCQLRLGLFYPAKKKDDGKRDAGGGESDEWMRTEGHAAGDDVRGMYLGRGRAWEAAQCPWPWMGGRSARQAAHGADRRWAAANAKCHCDGTEGRRSSDGKKRR